MQLFGKFYKRPARSSAPEDLSDVYLVLTLTTGRKTRDAWHDEDDVWHSWEVAYRDVVIIDGENKRRAVFNLTTDTLYLPDNYEHMKNTIRHLILYDTLPPEPEPEATDAGPGATDAGEGVTNANSDGWQGPF